MRVEERLRGDGTDAGLDVRHHGADSKEFGRNGDAERPLRSYGR